MIVLASPLTPEERRSIGLATLTASAVAVVTGLITWGFEEAKRDLAARRDKAKSEAQSPLP